MTNEYELYKTGINAALAVRTILVIIPAAGLLLTAWWAAKKSRKANPKQIAGLVVLVYLFLGGVLLALDYQDRKLDLPHNFAKELFTGAYIECANIYASTGDAKPPPEECKLSDEEQARQGWKRRPYES